MVQARSVTGAAPGCAPRSPTRRQRSSTRPAGSCRPMLRGPPRLASSLRPRSSSAGYSGTPRGAGGFIACRLARSTRPRPQPSSIAGLAASCRRVTRGRTVDDRLRRPADEAAALHRSGDPVKPSSPSWTGWRRGQAQAGPVRRAGQRRGPGRPGGHGRRGPARAHGRSAARGLAGETSVPALSRTEPGVPRIREIGGRLVWHARSMMLACFCPFAVDAAVCPSDGSTAMRGGRGDDPAVWK